MTDAKPEFNDPDDRFGWLDISTKNDGTSFIIYDRFRGHYVTGDGLPSNLKDAKQQARICNIAAGRAVSDMIDRGNAAIRELAMKVGVSGR